MQKDRNAAAYLNSGTNSKHNSFIISNHRTVPGRLLNLIRYVLEQFVHTAFNVWTPFSPAKIFLPKNNSVIIYDFIIPYIATMKSFIEGGFIEGPMISEIELLKQSIAEQKEFAKRQQMETEDHQDEVLWSGYYNGLDWVLNEIEMNKKLYCLK